jgi:hypothetical protein
VALVATAQEVEFTAASSTHQSAIH